MSVTRERFEQGMTYEAYKEQMTRNRERFDANEEAVELDAGDVSFFANLRQPINVLILAEDWCGDVIANLPVIGRLAEASGKLNLRIFLRDQNLDLMDQYLKDGQFRAIPVFVFFDADFNELGHWIERPAAVNERQTEMRNQLYANDPVFSGIAVDTPFGDLPEEARDHLRAAFERFREEQRPFSNSEVVREIRAIVEQGIPQATEQVTQIAAPAPAASNGSAPSTSGSVKVSIVYCSECGYQPQTLALTAALVDTFIHEISSIELIPWQDGTFDVTVNGDLVHSMMRDGGFPENETILQAVRERLGG